MKSSIRTFLIVSIGFLLLTLGISACSTQNSTNTSSSGQSAPPSNSASVPNESVSTSSHPNDSDITYDSCNSYSDEDSFRTDTAVEPEKVGKTYVSEDNLYEYTVLSIDGISLNSFYDHMRHHSTYTIPTEIDGYPVISIGDKFAFPGRDYLKELIVPGAIKEIGEYAFAGCDNLRKVTLEDGVSRLDAYAFEQCPSLQEFNMTDSVLYVEHRVWRYSEGVHRTVNGVTYVGKVAIGVAKELANEFIPLELEPDTIAIADWAFSDGPGNKATFEANLGGDINIPESVLVIGTDAFTSNGSGITFKIPSSVLEIGEHAIGYWIVNGQYKPFNAGNCKIYGAEFSEAERYASDNDITFVITN